MISSSSICNKSLERKVRKPKIEKLRRGRINCSLEKLKDILLRNTISIPQGSRPTKLEKADILEMSVRYIEMLHEKLSAETQKSSSSKLMENSFENISSAKRKREAFTDITNNQINVLNEKKIHHVNIINDHKSSASSSSSLWLYNRFNLHQRNESISSNIDTNCDDILSDKENIFFLNRMRQFNENQLSSISSTQQSIFSSSSECHWRPW